MPDYYPLIARAVSRLKTNTFEARQDLFDQARAILIATLRARQPPVSDSEIARECAALDGAIRKVESKIVSELEAEARFDKLSAIRAEGRSRSGTSAANFMRNPLHREPRLSSGHPLHRPTTTLLVLTILFLGVWVIDVTCMSLYWVARIPTGRSQRPVSKWARALPLGLFVLAVHANDRAPSSLLDVNSQTVPTRTRQQFDKLFPPEIQRTAAQVGLSASHSPSNRPTGPLEEDDSKASGPSHSWRDAPGDPEILPAGVTVELARRADGTPVVGVKLEGEIMPGDTAKLLALYEKYSDAAVSTVFLRSKGGDVEEAMKMGRLIRALRLETEVPLRYNGEILSLVPAANKDNFVCASACFLVFAGGVNRSGDFLVLHRPYLSKQTTRNLSDLGREDEQKRVMAEVRDYLHQMEVDDFFIDKMMWTSSQDAYVTTLADVLDHHLNGIVPSIEEIVLPSCDTLTQHERDLFDRSIDPKEREQLGAKLSAALTCERKQLDLLRGKAWDRQHEAELQAKCGALSPQGRQSLIAFFKKPPGQRSDADKQAIMPLLEQQHVLTVCKADLLAQITIAAAKRAYEAEQKLGTPTLPAKPAQPLDAKGLSAEDMLKQGDSAFNTKNYAEAMRWYSKAADLGNARAMLEISRLYASGSGVTRDDAEAMRWRNKAADQGDASVIDSIGADYEYGWNGMTQDYAEAMRWYRKAADLGNADAMLSIGLLYNSGQGVPQDYAEANRWLRKAADLGKTLAMYAIAVHYEYGDGVPQNDAEARLWMKKAAGLGDLAANMWLADNP